MSTLLAKAKVLLAAVPTWGAAAIAVLTVVADQIVPMLPGPMAIRVAGYVATAIAALSAVVAVVSRVTPAPVDKRGLLPPAA